MANGFDGHEATAHWWGDVMTYNRVFQPPCRVQPKSRPQGRWSMQWETPIFASKMSSCHCTDSIDRLEWFRPISHIGCDTIRTARVPIDSQPLLQCFRRNKMRLGRRDSHYYNKVLRKRELPSSMLVWMTCKWSAAFFDGPSISFTIARICFRKERQNYCCEYDDS